MALFTGRETRVEKESEAAEVRWFRLLALVAPRSGDILPVYSTNFAAIWKKVADGENRRLILTPTLSTYSHFSDRQLS